MVDVLVLMALQAAFSAYPWTSTNCATSSLYSELNLLLWWSFFHLIFAGHDIIAQNQVAKFTIQLQSGDFDGAD